MRDLVVTYVRKGFVAKVRVRPSCNVCKKRVRSQRSQGTCETSSGWKFPRAGRSHHCVAATAGMRHFFSSSSTIQDFPRNVKCYSLPVMNLKKTGLDFCALNTLAFIFIFFSVSRWNTMKSAYILRWSRMTTKIE